MSKYTPATFQPTVRPDWAGILSYLSDKEKGEILVALFKYPSVECDSAFWKETIKPELDLQYQAFIESCKAKSRGVRNRWGKISITDVEDMNKISIRDVIDTEREREREEESKSEKIGGAGGKNFVPPKDADEVYEFAQVNCMMCTKEQAQDFFDYYSGIGWRIGNEFRTPMNDWRPFWRKWLRNPIAMKNQFGQRTVRMTAKEIKEAENHIKLQKMLNGEL